MRQYVIRLGSFAGDGPYIRARDELDDWTITFDQRRAMRFPSLVDAELISIDFGDARPVRLRARPKEEDIHRESDDLHRPSPKAPDWYGRHEG